MRKTIATLMSVGVLAAGIAADPPENPDSDSHPSTPHLTALAEESPELQKSATHSDEALDGLLRRHGVSERILETLTNKSKIESRKLLNNEEKAARVTQLIAVTNARAKEEQALQLAQDEILSSDQLTSLPRYLSRGKNEIEFLRAHEASLRHQTELLRTRRNTYDRILSDALGDYYSSPEAIRFFSDFSALIEADLDETRYLLKDEIDILGRNRRIVASTTLDRLRADLFDPSISDADQRKQLIAEFLHLKTQEQDLGQVPGSPADMDKVKEKPLPIYLKLPLLQPRFHWLFTSPEQFMGCEISLTLARGDDLEEKEEISILKDGKLNPDWILCEKAEGYYFLLRSKKGHIRSAKTRATLRLKTDQDLFGRWGTNRGILRAGEYRSEAVPKIYWRQRTDPTTAEYAFLVGEAWSDLWVLEPVPAE